MTVELKIDDDSGKGVVFVKQTTVPATGNPSVTTDTISVTVAQVPTALAVSATPESINSGQGDAEAETTTILIRLTDAEGRGIASTGLTVIASHGTLSIHDDQDQPMAWDNRDVDGGRAFVSGGTQVGSIDTSTDGGANSQDGTGYAALQLTGGGAPGVATVTVRITNGALSGATNVILFGPPATISAAADQSAIAIGESTFVVVTVNDDAGNPVAASTASTRDTDGIAAPSKLDRTVDVSRLVNKDLMDAGEIDKGDIPACGTVAEAAAAPDADPPTPAIFASNGTDRAGMCVIQVTAFDDTTPLDNDTARGTHTLTIVASGDGNDPKAIDAVSVTIQVGGPPTSIESDAPASINPSDELTVNVTVLDDEVVRVGEVAIEAIQTAGSGKIITEIADDTSDGRAKFTYLAPSTPGVVEFLVRTKDGDGNVTAQLPIIVNIGEVAPVEPPAPAQSAVSLDLSAGGDFYVVAGNSVPTTAGDLFDGTSVSVAFKWENGAWTRYVPALGAEDFLVASGNLLWVVAGSAETVGG